MHHALRTLHLFLLHFYEPHLSYVVGSLLLDLLHHYNIYQCLFVLVHKVFTE